MLVSYRNSYVTPELAEALRKLEAAASALEIPGVRLTCRGVPPRLTNWAGVKEDPGPTELPPQYSMRPSGREIYLSLSLEGKESDPMTELSLLWGIAVPLGFQPWSRYPVPGPGQKVFHYLGDLAPLVDFLHSEGRGDLAWPSLCAAAQSLVSTWGGTKPTERKIQAHLHRLGIHSGPVDGEITEATLSSLRSLGFGGKPLMEVLLLLSKMKPPSSPPKERAHGFFTISGPPVEGFSSGGVELIRTVAGFTVTVTKPGRAIFEFGE